MTIKTIDVTGNRTSISCTILLDFSFKITPKQFKILAKIRTHKEKVSYLSNFAFTSKI